MTRPRPACGAVVLIALTLGCGMAGDARRERAQTSSTLTIAYCCDSQVFSPAMDVDAKFLLFLPLIGGVELGELGTALAGPRARDHPRGACGRRGSPVRPGTEIMAGRFCALAPHRRLGLSRRRAPGGEAEGPVGDLPHRRLSCSSRSGHVAFGADLQALPRRCPSLDKDAFPHALAVAHGGPVTRSEEPSRS